MAELVSYVKWAGRPRGGRGPGTDPFWRLVHRAGMQWVGWPEMEEGSWRKMLEAALPGSDLDDPGEVGNRPKMDVLTKLLRRVGRY